MALTITPAGEPDRPPIKRSLNQAHRVLWQHGQAQAGLYAPDTRALDYLTGWLDEKRGHRIGGIGFRSVAELAGDPAPGPGPRLGRQAAARH
jgi:hypothetical protein